MILKDMTKILPTFLEYVYCLILYGYMPNDKNIYHYIVILSAFSISYYISTPAINTLLFLAH